MRNRSRLIARLFATSGTMLPWMTAPALAVYNKEDDDKGEGGGGGGGKDDKKGEDDKGEGGGKDDKKGKPIPPDQYNAVVKDRDRLSKKLEELTGQFKELKDSMPEQAELEELRTERAKREKAEEDRKKAAGQFDEIRAKDKAKHADELRNKDGEIIKLRGRLNEERIGNSLGNLIPQFTTVAVSDVMPLLRPFISIEDKTEAMRVVGSDGEPLINPDTAKPYELSEFVEAEIGKRPYLAGFKPVGGSGSKSQRGGSGGTEFTEEQIAKMSQKEWEANKDAIFKSANANRPGAMSASGR